MSTERSDTSTSERGTTPGSNPSDEDHSDARPEVNGNGSTGSLEEDGSMVDWREQLRERVRQIRARKMAAQRADQAGFEESRNVAESIAASAARAQELRRHAPEDTEADDVPDDAEGEEAAVEASSGSTEADEEHDDGRAADVDAETLTQQTDAEAEIEATDERAGEPSPELDDRKRSTADELLEGVGSEADRSYDEDDTPDHTTFELDEPGAEDHGEEPDPELELELDGAGEDAEESGLETSEEPSSTTPEATATAEDEPPGSVDEVPLFQDETEPFGEGTALPDDEEVAATSRDPAESSRERPATGWWPRQPRAKRGPDLPADADIPVWARARSRTTDPQTDTEPAAAEAEVTAGTPDVEQEAPEATPEQDQGTETSTEEKVEMSAEDEDEVSADDPAELMPSGSDGEGHAEEHEAASGAPSELADVPIPAWARPREGGESRSTDRRRDPDDIHLVGEFRGKDARRDASERTPEREDSASADEHPDPRPTPETTDDMELPFLADEAMDDASSDQVDASFDETTDETETDDVPDPSTGIGAGQREEPRRSALEELLGETDGPGSTTGEPWAESGEDPEHDTAAFPTSPPESEGLPDDLPPPSSWRAGEPEGFGTTPETETDPDAEGQGSHGHETEPDPEEGAVPAAARSGLDLDTLSRPPQEDRDLGWDLDAPGDPDAVLEAQKPRGQVDESSAPISDRFFSALCDSLVLLAVALLLVGGAARAADASMVEILRNTPAPLAGTWLVFAFAYAVFFNGTCGQTLGKMIMRVRVIGAERFHVGYGRAARRAASYLLATLPMGLGLLPALRDAQRRALHDRLSGTRVVKA